MHFLAITALHNVWCYVFCGVLDLGVHGVGLATSVSWVLYGIAFVYVYQAWGTAFLEQVS